jgi:hypothetical protein
MADSKRVVVQIAGLLDLLAAPCSASKRQLLEEFLQNPFLDDDVQGLSLRVGISREEAEECLAELCREGLLKEAGRRGHMLDLDAVGEKEWAAQPVEGREPAPPATELDTDLAAQSWALILLRADGRPELVDEQAAAWLGVPAEELDAAIFEEFTGVDPGQVLGEAAPLSFTLNVSRPLAITLRACRLGGEAGVLVVLRDASLAAELGAVQAQIQEEVFGRLRSDLVEPVLLIQRFLENLEMEELGPARAALERLNRFLETFFLSDQDGKSGGTSPDSTP